MCLKTVFYEHKNNIVWKLIQVLGDFSCANEICLDYINYYLFLQKKNVLHDRINSYYLEGFFRFSKKPFQMLSKLLWTKWDCSRLSKIITCVKSLFFCWKKIHITCTVISEFLETFPNQIQFFSDFTNSFVFKSSFHKCISSYYLEALPVTLCFDERKYHPYLINIVKCFAARGDCLIYQTSPIPKFEQQMALDGR